MAASRIVTRLSLGLLALVELAACNSCGGPAAPSTETAPAPELETPAAEVSAPSIAPEVRSIEETEGVRYELYRFRFDLSQASATVVDLEFRTTLGDALAAEDAVLAINGGYWDTDMEPEGLTRVGGEDLAAFSTTLGGGVLVIDEGVGRLLDAEAPDLDVPDDADFAQQCMPRIVVDGALNIRRDDGRRADRTALCLRDHGHTLDVYVARGEEPDGHGGPTLWTFGELLVEEGCEAALNLDGGGSTGAVWRSGAAGLERLPPRVPLRLAVLLK